MQVASFVERCEVKKMGLFPTEAAATVAWAHGYTGFFFSRKGDNGARIVADDARIVGDDAGIKLVILEGKAIGKRPSTCYRSGARAIVLPKLALATIFRKAIIFAVSGLPIILSTSLIPIFAKIKYQYYGKR